MMQAVRVRPVLRPDPGPRRLLRAPRSGNVRWRCCSCCCLLERRITSVSRALLARFKARASFMFAGCCRWRSLAGDGCSGASRGHAPVVRRPGSQCSAFGQNGTVAERPIRLFGDPVLRTPCDAVDAFDDVLIRLVADLEETVSAPGRAGLAANQIGVSRRVFAYNIDGQVGHLVNPVVEATEGEQEDEEGCLSIPGLWYPLKRAQYVRARGIDQLGQPAIVEGEDLLARCIQHEVDHLNGRLFVDRLSGSARKLAMRDLREGFAS